MKKTLFTITVVTAFLCTAQAAVVTVSDASNTDWDSPTTNASFVNNAEIRNDGTLVGNRAGNGTTNTATYDVSDFIADGDSSGSTLQYTFGGLDIDGIGGFNDQVVINFTVTGHSTLTTLMDTTPDPDVPRNAGWLSSGGQRLDANGDFTQLDFSTMSVNLNGGSGNGSGTFGGFSEVELGSFNTSGDIAVVNSSSYAFDSVGNIIDLSPGGNDSSLNVSWVDGTSATPGGTPGYRIDNFSFEFTAVPEPGSLALFSSGIALSILMLRRRRR